MTWWRRCCHENGFIRLMKCSSPALLPEITPVRSIDGLSVGDGRRGPVTAELQDRFFAITSGEASDTLGMADVREQADWWFLNA